MSTFTESTVRPLPAGTWTIDQAHSAVEFHVRHLGITTVHGRALRFAGAIVGGDGPRIEGSVDTASITTFDEQRDAHLASPEFFDADRYSELRFVSSSIERDGDELAVRGELTIKGITRPIELRGRVTEVVRDPWGNERIGLDLAGEVDRAEFGLRWNAPLPGGGFLLPNVVTVSASFSAVKAS